MQSWQYQQAMEIGKRELEKREHEREQTAQRAREMDELRRMSYAVSRALHGGNRPPEEMVVLSDEDLEGVYDRRPLTTQEPLTAAQKEKLEKDIARAMGIREVDNA